MANNIKLTIEGQIVEVVEETIDMDYSITRIEDMGSVDSDRSLPIIAPYTQANNLVFEHLHDYSIENELPLRRLKCTLDDGGTSLLKSGVCRIKKAGRAYELELGGGNYNFLDSLKDLKLADLDWSEFDHFWTLATVHASRNNTEGYIYLVNNYFVDIATAPIDNTDRVIRADYLYPCVFVHTILKKMGEYTGVQITGDFLGTQAFKDLVLPFTRREYVRNDDNRRYLASFKFANNIEPNSTIIYTDQSLVVTNQTNYFTPTVPSLFTNFFWFADDVTVTFRIRLFVQTTFGGTINIRYTYFDGFNQQTSTLPVYVYYLNGWIERDITITTRRGLNLGALVLFKFGVAVPGSGNRITADSTIDIIDCKVNTSGNINVLGVGPNFATLSSALPEFKCSDLLKALANMYGLLFQYDLASNTVIVEQVKKVYDNKPIAVDWTSKIDPRTAQFEYELGSYGQSNLMVLSNPSEMDELQGSYAFPIPNEHLDAEKTVFKLPFQFTDNITLLEDLTLAHIPIIAADEDPDNSGQYLYKFSADSKPRILTVSRETPSGDTLDYYDGINTLTSSVVPLGYYYRIDGTNNLDLNTLINTYQAFRIAMLQKGRKVTLDVDLTNSDITELDFFIPIYISIWGKYFFINRISRQNKELSKVVLVEL